MSGKEAAPAASVEINDGAITMEEDRSRLYATSRLYAYQPAGSWALNLPPPSRGRPVAGAGPRPPSLQCAGAFGRVPGGRVVEAKYSECLRNEEIIFGAGFSTENRRNQSIIRRKLVLIRTTLIFV